MKSFTSLFLTICFFTAFAQEPKKVKSELSDVTIYTLGALVTESGTLTLNKGINKLVFTNIPRMLDTRILLLQFGGNAKVLSLSNGVQDVASWKQDPAYKAVQDSLEMLEKQKFTNSFLISSYNGEKDMLNENRSIGGTTNGVVNAELQKAVEYYRLRMADIHQLLLVALRTESELTKLQAHLQKRRADMEANFLLHNNIIYATVSSESVVNENFELRYFVNDCGWAPFYDVKITDISKPVTFVYNAKMYNNTGVSWNDVNLTISTADPSKSAQYPALDKWVLGESSADYKSYRGNKAKVKTENDENGGSYGNTYLKKPGATTTTISATELSIDFAIPDKKTIPTDARPYLVEIKSHNISPTYNYIAIPKLDMQAYLTCGIVDWEQYNFMEGPANVFYGKTFIGESYIAPHLADDTLEVSLGRDSKVMLKYEKKKDYTRKSILGNTTIQNFSYEITIRNTNTKDITVDLFDQVPISSSSDITVDVTEISKADWNKEDGKLQWNVNVKAGESVKYIVSYTIKYPKGKKVIVTRSRAVQCPTF